MSTPEVTAYMDEDPTARVLPTESLAYSPDDEDPLGVQAGQNQVGVLGHPVIADPVGETYTDPSGQPHYVLASERAANHGGSKIEENQ